MKEVEAGFWYVRFLKKYFKVNILFGQHDFFTAVLTVSICSPIIRPILFKIIV